MRLFRKDYQAERQFMRKSYIRLRGRTWFLVCYAIGSTFMASVTVIYATLLLDWIIRVVGGYVSSIWQYTQTQVWQLPVFDDVKNNVALIAILAYLASEDPEKVSAEKIKMPIDSKNGEPAKWPSPSEPTRLGGFE